MARAPRRRGWVPRSTTPLPELLIQVGPSFPDCPLRSFLPRRRSRAQDLLHTLDHAHTRLQVLASSLFTEPDKPNIPLWFPYCYAYSSMSGSEGESDMSPQNVIFARIGCRVSASACRVHDETPTRSQSEDTLYLCGCSFSVSGLSGSL